MSWFFEENTTTSTTPTLTKIVVTIIRNRNGTQMFVEDDYGKQVVNMDHVHDNLVNGTLKTVTIVHSNTFFDRRAMAEVTRDDTLTLELNVRGGKAILEKGDGTRIEVPLHAHEVQKLKLALQVNTKLRVSASDWSRLFKEVFRALLEVAKYRRGTVITR